MNWELLIPIVIAFIGGGALVEIIRQRSQKPYTEAQSKDILSEAWERVMKENSRQMENLRRAEIENAELRPVVLKLAIQEQEMKQCHEDKEDWKRYAKKLAKQLEDANMIPIPFQRYPSGDTGKMEAIMSANEKEQQDKQP